MEDQFTVTLPEFQFTQTFSRSKFLQAFPNSLISNTLELTHEKDIVLTQPFVIPKVLKILHNMLEEGDFYYQSSDTHREHVAKSADYLGIDVLAIVNDEKFQGFSYCLSGVDLLSSDSIKKKEGSLLYNVGECNFISLLRYLMSKGLNPGVNNNSLIREASKRGYTEMVELLLRDERVDPSSGDNEALKEASSLGYTEIVKLLLKDKRVNPYDPSNTYNNPLYNACSRNHLEIVKLILADPRTEAKDGFFDSAFTAGIRFHIEIFKLLLDDPRTNMGPWIYTYTYGGGSPGHKQIEEMVSEWFKHFPIP